MTAWILLPALLFRKLSRSTSLDQESAEIPDEAPTVSVIIPARNEASNIERCVSSMLRTTYPSVDITVVDDGSTDETRSIVERIAAIDSRVRVIVALPLPEGWLGQQWGLLNGARSTAGAIICFADADTWHEEELLARAVNGIVRRNADMLSVSCRQEFGTFWERVVQPQVLMVLAARYGGTEDITNSSREEDKMAGGPCILVRREAYESVGGHEVTKGYIANDVMLARGFFRGGRKVAVTHAGNHAHVRMYSSLRGMVEGWGKNIILGTRISSSELGARDAVKSGLLFGIPLFQAVPLAAAALGLAAGSSALVAWGALASAIVLFCWAFIYRLMNEPVWYAALFPAGAAVLFFILARSVAGGRRIRWRGREYVSR